MSFDMPKPDTSQIDALAKQQQALLDQQKAEEEEKKKKLEKERISSLRNRLGSAGGSGSSATDPSSLFNTLG